MKTILVPVDFSEGTDVLCKNAIQFAGVGNAKLFLFHIYPDQLMIPDSSFPIGLDTDTLLNAEYIDEIRKQARVQMIALENWFRAYLKDNGITNIEVQQMVTGGDPEHEITQLCKELSPYIVVMGTRGEGNKGILEGSMAKKIMVKSSAPVLAIPFSKDKIKINKILYATNFSKNDYSLLQSLYKLLLDFDIELYIVHFELKGHPKEDDMMMDTLKHAMTSDYPDKKIHFDLIESHDRNEALRTFVEENNIDMISFIAHKSNLLKNIFTNQMHKKDFFKLEIPMLALHE